MDGSEKILEPVAKLLKQSSVDDLYVAVATGVLGPKDVVNTAYPELKEIRTPRMLPAFMGGALTARSPRNAPRADAGLPITGLVSGMDVHYAGCCHPLPGDRIVGIVTTGKPITIHTKDCAQLDQYAAFLRASADEIVDKALGYVFSKDREFQDFLRTPEAGQIHPSLRVRHVGGNGGRPRRARQSADGATDTQSKAK